MEATWLRTPDGRAWEVRPGSEEAKRLQREGARKVAAPGAPERPASANRAGTVTVGAPPNA